MPIMTQSELEVSSVSLVPLDNRDLPGGMGSGCLMDYYGHRLLLTVLHNTFSGRPLALEIEWVEEKRRMAMWKLGGLHSLDRAQLDPGGNLRAQPGYIDFAYVDLPTDIAPRLQKIDWYTTQITESRPATVWSASAISEPTASARYGFAGHTKPSLEDHSLVVPDVKCRFTELRTCFPLTYVASQGDFHLFRLPVEHPGHDSFKGCSGAPIIDEDGHVVALVSRGDTEQSLIYGLSLQRYRFALDIHTGRFG